MDFQGWSAGLALRPCDYLGKGRALADVVRSAGPFKDEALYLLALSSAATLARLHMAGIAGLRLNPGNVMIGPRGEGFFAAGPRDSEFPSKDMLDWAGVIVFAATGRQVDEEPGFDRLPPALRAVIDECRRSDPAARPTAVDLVRILLGHSTPATAAIVADLLRAAEDRIRLEEPSPYEETLVFTPLWRKPAYVVGIAIGVLVVAALAGLITLFSRQAAGPDLFAHDEPLSEVTNAYYR
jgi:hypothetical protein